jgi:hypothetical protein
MILQVIVEVILKIAEWGSNMYPTKKEILKYKIPKKKESLLTMRIWKKDNIKNWKNKTSQEKIRELNKLINNLNKINQGKNLRISETDEYCYNTKEKMIFHDTYHPSIVSSLHELAHHLYGPSELIACAWSIQHFLDIFPKQYKKLQWKGHLLTIIQ